MAGRKGADKHTIQSQDRDPTQPAPCSQTHQLLRCSFPKTFAPANPSTGGQVGCGEGCAPQPKHCPPRAGLAGTEFQPSGRALHIHAEPAAAAPAGQQSRADPQGGQHPPLPGLSASFCLFQCCLEHPLFLGEAVIS